MGFEAAVIADNRSKETCYKIHKFGSGFANSNLFRILISDDSTVVQYVFRCNKQFIIKLI